MHYDVTYVKSCLLPDQMSFQIAKTYGLSVRLSRSQTKVLHHFDKKPTILVPFSWERIEI